MESFPCSQESHQRMNMTNITAVWIIGNETLPGTSLSQIPCTDQGKSCMNFQFVLNTVVIGTLCLLGLAGNTLSILVLQKDRHNRVAVFLLQALAVADNSVLCLSIFVLSIVYGLRSLMGDSFLESLVPIIIRYINPLGYMAQSCVIWITVLLAVNRYVAVCRPFTAKRWITMTSVRLQVALVVIISFGINVPRFIHDTSKPNCTSAMIHTHNFSDTYSSTENTTSVLLTTVSTSLRPCHVDDPQKRVFEMIYLNVFYTAIVLILPLLLMFGFNIPLIRQIQESKRRMIENSLSYRGLQENNITVVMVVIVLVMIVCHAPDRAVQILRATHAVVDTKCPSTFFYASNFANLLVMINSSTDFIIYYVFRRRFRTILWDKLRCCCVSTGIRVRDRNGDCEGGSAGQRASRKEDVHIHKNPDEMELGTPFFRNSNTDTNPMVHFIETNQNQIADEYMTNH